MIENEAHKINVDKIIVFFPPILSSKTPPIGEDKDNEKFIIGNKK